MDIKEVIFLIKNFIFKNSAFKKYLKAKENDVSSFEGLKALNWEKRKYLVNFAYQNVPFYNSFYNQEGFNPNDLKTEADWIKVPVLTKELIRTNFKELRNPSISFNRDIISSTGGTSGEPLKVLHDKQNSLFVNSWRVMNWWGLSVCPNIAFVFRLTRNTPFRKFVNYLMWFPTKRIFLNASSILPENIEPFVKKLISNKCVVLQGYTGALNELALYVIENDIKIECLKAVWCTSSPLTDIIRANLKDAFRSDIYDQYGSGEVYWIATECREHKGLHIHSDIRHVDIVDEFEKPLNNGNKGSVLITDLENFLFPIIRYKNGDLSLIEKEKCLCGRPYPLLKKIYGRTTDSIKLPNGGFIAGDYFTTIFDDYVEIIKKFQVHQTSEYIVNINVVLKEDTPEGRLIVERVSNIIKDKVSRAVPVICNILTDLEDNNAGKNKFIICDIK